MKFYLECLPCMLRQVLESADMTTNDEEIKSRIMKDAIKALIEFPNIRTAPEMAYKVHSLVKKHTGKLDPYEDIKRRDIAIALNLEPKILKYLEKDNSMENILKISATGNVMDSAMNKNLDVESCFDKEIQSPFKICDIDAFLNDIKDAKLILIIGDNSGEAVFDKVLVKKLSEHKRVVYAVRGQPIINDVTCEDAKKTGIDKICEVVSSGCGTPGAVLEYCNKEFVELFEKADVIISKGQGNFEALSENKKEIYFLLKAKCIKIAKELDVLVNDYVFLKSNK